MMIQIMVAVLTKQTVNKIDHYCTNSKYLIRHSVIDEIAGDIQ